VIYKVKIPLVKPYKLSNAIGTINNSESIIIKIKTDSGLVGYGEANPMPFFTVETLDSIVEVVAHSLSPIILGADPLNINKINKEMDEKLSGNLLAKGAIDIALHDLLGKKLNIPIHQLFGGSVRRKIPLLWPIGSNTPDKNITEIKEKMHQGFNTFMIKTGELALEEDIKRVREISKICNHSTTLFIDANQGWDIADTIEFARSIEDCKVSFIEQPIPGWDLFGLSTVKEKVSIPISVDESLTSIYKAGDIIRYAATDYFSVKVSKNGGLSRSIKIIHLAESFGIPCLINSMIELGISQAASLQLSASQTNLINSGQCLMSTLRISDDITNFKSFISNGEVAVPDTPGLGIKIDQKKLDKYTVTKREII